MILLSRASWRKDTILNSGETRPRSKWVGRRGASHGRLRFSVFDGWRPGVLSGPSVMESEIVQVKHDRDPPRTIPAHQLEAGRMAAIGQQYMGSKPLQNLVGQRGVTSD